MTAITTDTAANYVNAVERLGATTFGIENGEADPTCWNSKYNIIGRAAEQQAVIFEKKMSKMELHSLL